MTRPILSFSLAIALAVAAPVTTAGAQVPDSTRRDSTVRDSIPSAAPQDAPAPAPAPPPAPAPAALPFDFSGVLYANYQYGGVKGNRSQNRFDINRVYLTFRGGAGEHVSYRVTADIFQNTNDAQNQFYGGWAYRLKYAYGQYDYIRGIGDELKANVRLGLLHTPIIDYEEQFWPRGIQQVAIEQAGFFSSADAGVATLVTLPDKFGEFYATVVNGNGYTQRETDRFKDYGARLTLTPFAATHGIARTFAVTPWYYKGTRASDFSRKRGTVLPVSEGRQKDRYGVHIGIRDPRITLATQIAWRTDVVETADTTVATAPRTTDRDGRVVSAYTIVKPLAFANVGPTWPINLLFRVDDVKPNRDAGPYYRQYITGLGWDFSKKVSLWADAQVQQPRAGSTVTDLRTYFLHAIVNF